MIGDELFTLDFIQEVTSEIPDCEKIRQLVIQAFNKENGTTVTNNINIIDNLGECRQINLWLNKIRMQRKDDFGLLFSNFFYKKEFNVVPRISFTLSDKVNVLSQRVCGICIGSSTLPIVNFKIRITPISHQASSGKIKRAFKKAVASRVERIREFNANEETKICINIIFILTKNSKNKDLDNMAQILLDSLQEGLLFENDVQVEHLSLLKIRGEIQEGEEFISVNIMESFVNEHKDTIFDFMSPAVNWGNMGFLKLEDFMD
jgi:Holliday junction resolvase RusA-like endonuclease